MFLHRVSAIDALTVGLNIAIEPVPASAPDTDYTPGIASAPDLTRINPNVVIDGAELLGRVTTRKNQVDFLRD